MNNIVKKVILISPTLSIPIAAYLGGLFMYLWEPGIFANIKIGSILMATPIVILLLTANAYSIVKKVAGKNVL